MKTHSKRNEEYWNDHIDSWKLSELSKAEYCRGHQLKPHQLTYWYGKLRSKSEGRKKRPPIDSKPAFIPVTMMEPSAHSALTICLPSGLRIEGVSSSSLVLTQQLVEVLK